MNTTITNVFFDLDHTLWDFDKNSSLAFKAIFERRSIAVNLDDFLSVFVTVNKVYWDLFRKDEINHKELRFGRLQDTFKKLGFHAEEALIDAVSLEYVDCLSQYNYLIPGAIEILDYLSGRYDLHIITNGFAKVQQRKLENSYISHYFKTVTNAEMVGVKKPNPALFEHALKLAKAQKNTSIMIGDCLESDVLGALQFGMDAVFFNEHSLAVQQNVKQVNSLLELKKYL